MFLLSLANVRMYVWTGTCTAEHPYAHGSQPPSSAISPVLPVDSNKAWLSGCVTRVLRRPPKPTRLHGPVLKPHELSHGLCAFPWTIASMRSCPHAPRPGAGCCLCKLKAHTRELI